LKKVTLAISYQGCGAKIGQAFLKNEILSQNFWDEHGKRLLKV